MSAEYKIAARGVSKSFGRKHVLRGADLLVPRGQSTVIIGGVVQPTVSRQTMLRDRYISLQHDQLPLAYPR